jgi:hypothetical protein
MREVSAVPDRFVVQTLYGIVGICLFIAAAKAEFSTTDMSAGSGTDDAGNAYTKYEYPGTYTSDVSCQLRSNCLTLTRR